MIERHVAEFADWLAKSHLPPHEQAAQMSMRRAVS
jgi:hypothetical protein